MLTNENINSNIVSPGQLQKTHNNDHIYTSLLGEVQSLWNQFNIPPQHASLFLNCCKVLPPKLNIPILAKEIHDLNQNKTPIQVILCYLCFFLMQIVFSAWNCRS
jgi:hypothetical protein